jgi:hypothetical protein
MSNIFSDGKNLVSGFVGGLKSAYTEIKPEAAYAASGAIRLTKVSFHVLGDTTNGVANGLEMSSAFSTGFINKATNGTTQPERVVGSEARGEALYESFFGDEDKANNAGL